MPTRNSHLVEDVEWLATSGVPPEQWPQRLDRTAQAIAKALYRAGRPDLARPASALAQRYRHVRDPWKPCPECGKATKPRATYCSFQCWVASNDGRASLARAGRARAAQPSSPPPSRQREQAV